MDRALARRGSAALIALLLAGLLPVAAHAAPPARFTDRSTYVYCGLSDASEAPVAVLWFGQVGEFGAFGDVAYWAEGSDPESDPPTLVTDFEREASGATDATSFSLVIPLEDVESGEPAGEATFEATLAADGDPIPVEERHRFGNAWERVSGTTQPLTVTDATLVVDGITFEPTDCAGDRADLVIFATNPNAWVNSGSVLELSCGWEIEGGFISLFAFRDRDFGFADLFVDPLALVGSTDQFTFTTTAFSAEFELFNWVIEEPTGESASASATLEPAGPAETETIIFQTGRAKQTVQPFTVSGTLEIPGLGTFDMAEACIASSVDFRSITTRPQGPKPGTRPPANDAPEGAVAVAGPVRFNVQTSGASFDPEVEASCLPEDPDFGQQFGRTVWYRIAGTGDPVTIDTAGSNFDTAIAVYVDDGGTLVEVACLDDSPTGDFSRTLQARLTFDTTAGETYFIQIGGYAGEHGLLRVRVE